MAAANMTLAGVLGHPPGHLPLGSARTPLWRSIEATLRFHLPPGLHRVRSPRTLWSILRGCPPPRGARWHDLTDGADGATLVQALQAAARAPAARFATWNIRWLRSPHTSRGTTKLKELTELLLAGTIVAVQETHWTEADAAVWGGLFPGSQVASSPASRGPRGGPQGGVALLIPHPWVVLQVREVLPGRYLEADVAQGPGPDAPRLTVASFYAPPEHRSATIRDLANSSPPPPPLPTSS